MEGLHKAVAMMTENGCMAGIYLADPYYCVPVQGSDKNI